MLNNGDISDGIEAGKLVDVDGMAEKIARLKGEEGVTVVGQGELAYGETRRVQSPVVPTQQRVKPSFGGKIKPGQQSSLAEADERFRCGG